MKAYALPVGNSPEVCAELRGLIGLTCGHFFSVLFVARGTNQPRKMLARLKVVTPGMRSWARQHVMLVAWDIQKKDWRYIPLERVVRFKGNGEEWLC